MPLRPRYIPYKYMDFLGMLRFMPTWRAETLVGLRVVESRGNAKHWRRTLLSPRRSPSIRPSGLVGTVTGYTGVIPRGSTAVPFGKFTFDSQAENRSQPNQSYSRASGRGLEVRREVAPYFFWFCARFPSSEVGTSAALVEKCPKASNVRKHIYTSTHVEQI